MGKWQIVENKPGAERCCILDLDSGKHIVCIVESDVASQIVGEHNSMPGLAKYTRLYRNVVQHDFEQEIKHWGATEEADEMRDELGCIDELLADAVLAQAGNNSKTSGE